MSSTKIEFLTPTMRMVQGDPFDKQTKDMQGNPLVIKTGPNKGQLTQRYFVAGAIPKNDPAWPAFQQQMLQAARLGFPTLFDAQGNCLAREFSWKIADGDDTRISKPGDIPNAQKKGFPGHWIVKFTSAFQPSCYYTGRYPPQHRAIEDVNVIRRGHYIRVMGTMEGNGQSEKPGIYVNLGNVDYVGVGEEIISGPNVGAVFGQQAAQLPQGAQPLPMNAGNGAMPGMMQPPAQQFAPPAGPPGAMPFSAPAVAPFMMPGAAPGAMPSAPLHPNNPAAGMAVQPHPGILQGPGVSAPPQQQFAPPGGVPGVPMAQPGMPMPQYQPPAPVVRQMTAAAGPYTYEQFIALGHTDASLRQQGLML